MLSEKKYRMAYSMKYAVGKKKLKASCRATESISAGGS